ncbi:MAG: hypothetical protein KBD66_01025 [Candidatus Doudnabacteria bacterium]|nr:hypothetical protein [Candidatus Doudnabacteria bacterium]
MRKPLTFDEVFKIWIDAEVGQVERTNILPVAKAKGFDSIVKWRLASALRLGLDKREWTLETLEHPNDTLPHVVIGPYQGWSVHFENTLHTSFAEALRIPTFLGWVTANERIMNITAHFPTTNTFILFRKPDGTLIHIEGGHRMCATAYMQHIRTPINFSNRTTLAAVTHIAESELPLLHEFLKLGTNKQ